MSAPDRSADVVAVVAQHRNLFGSDNRRRGLLYYICGMLNAKDDGNWGVLTKTDQGDVVPSDIIVWAPTREHFDVLASDPDRAAWQPKGVLLNPAWIWTRATTILLEPLTLPPLDEPPAPGSPWPDPPDTGPLVALEPAEIVARLAELVVPLIDQLGHVAIALQSLDHRVADVQANGVKVRFR